MNSSIPVDLGHIARDLNLPVDKVQRTAALLDEGNTVPFITRFRKDHTGGLDEEQVRAIQLRIGKARLLAERKQTILKTIESQGKLTPDLAEHIQNATTAKRLEDLYLPYKPKKQSLASLAREKGLEPLAQEILDAAPEAADLQARAASFVAAEKDLPTTTEVLQHVGYVIAERYSESAELRGKLRRIFHRTGKLVCTKIEPPPEAASAPAEGTVAEQANSEQPAGQPEPGPSPAEGGINAASAAAAPAPASAAETTSEPATVPMSALTESIEAAREGLMPAASATATAAAESQLSAGAGEPSDPAAITAIAQEAARRTVADAAASPTASAPAGEVLPEGKLFAGAPAAPILAPELKKLKKKKKKKRVVGEHAFKDYYNYSEPLHRVPPHRVLAINRGERARAIRVKIQADERPMQHEAEHLLVPRDHPHAEFLRQCVRDALTRLVIPSLEREIRREMTEKAEEHAVGVFVRNLRKLLLQPPVRGRRVLAIDPGFKSGCKMVALDEFGNPLGHSVIYVIGKEDRRAKSRQRLAEFARQYNVSVIAIGNGTGCREAEQLVADVLEAELKDRDISYTIVNEAGASIYSTSPLGREELPQCDPLQRGAVSIGRRLLDPLSEMVKINPANLGVGLYQHDLKAKHLQDSLDSVVESCVNFVGVDVNTASPALLRYVSGMNALTARRVYEYRREHGPFRNREELKKVTGFGEQTFVQAAGFLKVLGGENPLDATWIHPESYEIAEAVLEKLGCNVADLAKTVPAPPPTRPQQLKLKFGEFVSAQKALEAKGQGRPVGNGKPQAAESPPEVTSDAASAAKDASPPAASESAPAPSEVGTPADSPPAAPDSTPAPTLATTDTGTAPEAAAAPQPASESSAAARNLIAERAAQVNVEALAGELGIGTHLLKDILASLTRPALDPRDNLPAPIFRRGIMKLEDLTPGMELQGTVLNVVDFGVFVDIGLSDSGLVHISRLADRFIKDPHEVVGVGDVLKVWVVDVDKGRRRVSLTAIPPGQERQPRPQREQQRPQRPQHPKQQRPSRPPPVAAAAALPAAGRPPAPHARQGQGRRDQRRGGGRPQQHGPKVVERPPTKPKVVKPITKAMEEGKEAMRSFGQLLQLFEKKKQKSEEEPPTTEQ